MKYRVGIDTASSGAVSIVDENNVIINVIKFPEREYDKQVEKEIDKKLKTANTKTLISKLKAQKKKLKRRAFRNYKSIYDLLLKYKKDIVSVIIEEPIMHAMNTSIDAIFINALSLGVYTAICSILGLEYQLKAPKEWHEYFNFDKDIPTGLDSRQRREKIKELSIKYAYDKFDNMNNFAILPRHKKIDDNICEACLLSLCGDN